MMSQKAGARMKVATPLEEIIPRDSNGKPLKSKYLKPAKPVILPPVGLDLQEIWKGLLTKRETYFKDAEIIKPLEYTKDEILALRYWCETGEFLSLKHIGIDRYMLSLDAHLLTIKGGHITKGSIFQGRRRFSLQDNNGGRFQIMANVLMGKAFLPPPPTADHNTVDHMDIDETNDYFYNLRWATKKAQAKNRKKSLKPRHGKAVLQLDPTTRQIVRVWRNLTQATKEMNFNSISVIGNATKSGYISGGFRWAYDYRSLMDHNGTIERWIQVQPNYYKDLWASSMGRVCTEYSGCWYGSDTPSGRKVVRVPIISGGHSQEFVHRLVALAFIGVSPPDKPSVDHIDGNPRNNRPENLRYLSIGDNNRHSVTIGTSKGKANPNKCKPIVQLGIDGKFIEEFPSFLEAQRQTYNGATTIRKAIVRGDGLTGGYMWALSSDYFK